jgi:hypothetical protein
MLKQLIFREVVVEAFIAGAEEQNTSDATDGVVPTAAIR